MKRTKIVITAALLAAACALSACQKKAETVELEILLSDDTLEGGAMAHIVEKFNEEHKDKGVQVKINEIAYADMKTQVQNRASVNELPALIRSAELISYTDFLHPLNDTSLKQKDFFLEGSTNDNFYGTTVNVTAVGLLINKTAFDNAGVAYPLTEDERWTWDEFEAAVREVMEKDERIQTGLVIDHSQQRIGTVLYHFGMKYYDVEDPDKVLFRSEETRTGLNYLLDMYKEGGISKASVGVGTENAQDVFKTGTIAAHLAGNWVVNDYMENIADFEWYPVLMPYAKEKATCLGGNYLYACAGTGQEEAAVKFMEWFYQEENYKEYCAVGNYLPGKRDIKPEYSYDGLDMFNRELAVTISQPVIDNGIQLKYHGGESWGNALRDGMDQAIAGELDADGVIDYVVKEILDNYTGVYE